MIKLKGTKKEIREGLQDIILESMERYAGLVEELTLIDYEEMQTEEIQKIN